MSHVEPVHRPHRRIVAGDVSSLAGRVIVRLPREVQIGSNRSVDTRHSLERQQKHIRLPFVDCAAERVKFDLFG